MCTSLSAIEKINNNRLNIKEKLARARLLNCQSITPFQQSIFEVSVLPDNINRAVTIENPRGRFEYENFSMRYRDHPDYEDVEHPDPYVDFDCLPRLNGGERSVL